MLSEISRNWWIAALRGALAVLFGVVAFVLPGMTFEVLVLLFGAYAFIDGLLVLGFGLTGSGWHAIIQGVGASVLLLLLVAHQTRDKPASVAVR